MIAARHGDVITRGLGWGTDYAQLHRPARIAVLLAMGAMWYLVTNVIACEPRTADKRVSLARSGQRSILRESDGARLAARCAGLSPRDIGRVPWEDRMKTRTSICPAAVLLACLVSPASSYARTSFGPKQNYGMGASPVEVPTRGFNRDARLELAVANWMTRTTTWFRSSSETGTVPCALGLATLPATDRPR
jgi:hypothetical protein